MKDKVLVNKVKIYIILKLKNSSMKNLILKMEYIQDKEDLVKLENVKVNQENFL